MLITAFYHFEDLAPERRRTLETALYAVAKATGLRGLCLLGSEGLNLTCSGDDAAIAALKDLLARDFGAAAERAQDSRAERHPFRHFKVRRRVEIVTLGKPELVPRGPRVKHLSPAEWHRALNDDVTVLDTRNDYEVALGKFDGAIDLNTKEFREFPEKIRAANLPKDKPVLMYCTGGIRCEKAALEMEAQGFTDVRQLEGGILNYLKEYPEQNFAGDCFVFDYRVAVDQHLAPTTRYNLCPHCGQPASVPITCVQCGSPAEVCSTCEATCSKNCAHHHRLGSASRRPHLGERAKRSGAQLE